MIKFCRLKRDFLKFTGNDRLDLINRLSTNKVDNLKRYGTARTILTTEKGRFVDILTLFNFGDFVFTLCSSGNSSNVITHLNKYTIMDDFKIENLTSSYDTILFFNNGTNNFVKKVFDSDISVFNRNEFLVFDKDNRQAVLVANDDIFSGYIFIFNINDTDYVIRSYFNLDNGFEEIDDIAFERMRIEFGIPRLGYEMTENTNPLECGLHKYINFNKGCYLGQEVIARLDSYDKISKHMIRIKAYSEFFKGDKILLNDSECGYVTSSVKSTDTAYTGIGFIKTSYLDFSKTYLIKTNKTNTECKIIKITT